jgi:hypothetical protein
LNTVMEAVSAAVSGTQTATAGIDD